MDWVLWCQITLWLCIAVLLIVSATTTIMKQKASLSVTVEQMKKMEVPSNAYTNQS